jgi:hypothetical protein
MPVLFVDYDGLVDDPPRVVARLLEFLAGHDQLLGAADHDAIDSYVSGGLRHSTRERAALDADARVSVEQRVLYDAIVALLGAHERFETVALPRETPWAVALIAARRAPSTPEQVALDAVTRELGATEARLDACAHEVGRMRDTFAAVEASLGYTAIGRLERGALDAAGRVRRLQQRLSRR